MEIMKQGMKIGDTTVFDLEGIFLRLLMVGQQCPYGWAAMGNSIGINISI